MKLSIFSAVPSHTGDYDPINQSNIEDNEAFLKDPHHLTQSSAAQATSSDPDTTRSGCYTSSRSISRQLHILVLFCALLLLIASVLLLVVFSNPTQKSEAVLESELYVPTQSLGLQCGDSTAEAKAQGCVFDMLTYSWTPRVCIEPVTNDEFREWLSNPRLHRGAFPFFADKAGTQRFEDEYAFSMAAENGTRRTWSTMQGHWAHCVFTTRRNSRLIHGGEGRFTERGSGLAHDLHCSKMILNGLEEDLHLKEKSILHTFVDVGFNSC